MSTTLTRVSTALLLALSALACTPKPQTEPLTASDVEPFRSCARDEDCMWINNGCCDCANGGEEVAIARKQEAAFKARFDCSKTGCTEVESIPACGTGTVSCESSRCVFRPQQP